MSTQEITCKCGCGLKRMVRTADVKRGWGLYFNKRCKAVAQERRTGQHGNWLARQEAAELYASGGFMESGDLGHGQN